MRRAATRFPKVAMMIKPLQGRNCKVERKRYARKFQRKAVGRMRSRDNIGELAKELGVQKGAGNVAEER